MAVKLDLAKAFDKVEWHFLEALLSKIGFSETWVSRVMLCVSSVSMAVMVNGNPTSIFKPERGLRQGDPLSPFLFIIVANVLSSLFEEAKNRGEFEGYKVKRSSPSIDHLLFADDCLIFTYADINYANCLKSILDKFQQATGQRVNIAKSSIFFSPNTSPMAKELIFRILNMPEMEKGSKYLGLPSIWGRGKVAALDFVLEKVRSKIDGWKGRILSQAGREILMKAVASAIPTYVMQGFLLPKTFCNKLNSLLGKFWWKGSSSEKGAIYWIGWPKLVKAKRDGGMSFRDFNAFNKALLAKQAWRTLSNPEALWVRLLRSIYFVGDDLMEAKKGSKASWGWQSLLEGINLLKKGVRWNVNNGRCIMIWKDQWLPREVNFKVSHEKFNEDAPIMPSSLIDEERRMWKLDALEKWFTGEDRKVIEGIPIGAFEDRDDRIWHFNRDGNYSVKSGYYIALKNLNEPSNQPRSSFQKNESLWNSIWKLKVIPRIKNFLWRACHDSLPTSENLCRRFKLNLGECYRCGGECESLEHVIFLCPFATASWRFSNFNYSPNPVGFSSFARWWIDICKFLNSNNAGDRLPLIAILCWNLWTCRNEFIFYHHASSSKQVWEKSVKMFEDMGNSMDESRSRFGNSQGDMENAIDVSENHWSLPNAGWIKLNCDASWQAETGNYGSAAILRNGEGMVLDGCCFSGYARSIRVAEALSIRDGLLMAVKGGWNHIIVENDNKNLIHSLKGNLQNCWDSRSIEKDVLRMGKSIEVIFMKINRSSNKAADWVAKQVRLGKLNSDWVVSFPYELVEILQADCNANY